MSDAEGSPSARDFTEDEDSRQETPDSSRQQFRRYRKRRSAAGLLAGLDTPSRSPLPASSVTPDTSKYASPLSPEDTKQRMEADDFKTPKISRKLFHGGDTGGLADLADDLNVSGSQERSQSREQRKMTPRSAPQASPFILKAVKKEDEELGEVSTDSAEESFGRFATILEATLQGHLTFPELMVQCEGICRELAELVREEATNRHRVTEDRLMRQKALMLHGEAASWSLLWHLFGKGQENLYSEDDALGPTTSLQEACEFIAADQNAQLCFRIVQWLETLASKELDYEKKHKGWYAGSYGQKLGLWRHTQRAIRKKVGQGVLVQSLDPDAPTREQARIHPEDEKLEQSLLEDVWKLILAGRLDEAQDLCRSAGQSWRAASLGGCGELGPSPSVEAWRGKGKDWGLQAVELESGIGHQRRLWKWACYCASEKIGGNSDECKYEAATFAAQCGNAKLMLPVCFTWEAACWVLVRSWLDVQVDSELARLHGLDSPNDGNEVVSSSIAGALGTPEIWPHQVADQQPRDLFGVFQKLLSGDLVHENVKRGCKEQQRLIQMDLMLGDISNLLDLLRMWIAPAKHSGDGTRIHGHPQMIRFGAHVVLALRYILAEDLKEHFRDKLAFIGDLILNTYAIFLFTQRREDLVGVYASQLAPHLCVELYVHMMDLRENESVPVKYKIFRSAMEHLPFFPEDAKKGCFSDILERVLSKSRDIRPGLAHPVKSEEVIGSGRHQTMRKAHAVQWLCFTPPAGLPNVELLRAELLARALDYSNLLFREFSLMSLWRTTEMPVGAHVLLGHLAEPLNQPTEVLLSLEEHQVQENLQEFEEWREYYSCDALYRNWLKIEHGNLQVPSGDLSPEEKERATSAAQQSLTAACSLLQRNHGMWLAGGDEVAAGPFVADWLELQCTAAVTSLSGSLVPDATVCTALMDALHYCGAEHGVQRQLAVDVSINPKDESLIEIGLRCLSVKGDGLSFSADYDGGLLASIIAYAVKGDLPHFRNGLVVEILRLDAWYVDGESKQRTQAAYIVQGLCRRCCLPELILRCMQVSVSLASEQGDVEDNETFELLEMVASKDFELYRLFSQRQLQELLQFERNANISNMEYIEDQQLLTISS